MTKNTRSQSERFAAASDALLAGQAGAALMHEMNDDLAPELAVAVRLREAARPGVPDPAFVEGLRRELAARV